MPVSAVLALVIPAPACPASAYLARLAPGSRRSQAGALDALAAILTGRADARACAWHHVRYPQTLACHARLAAGGYAPATVRRYLCALRGVLREAWRLGLMPGDAYHRAVDLPPVRGTRLPPGRALDPTEIRQLLDHGDPADAAAVALLYGGGLRLAEVTTLRMGQFDAETGVLAIRGKGDKERAVPLPPWAREAACAWLAVHPGRWRGASAAIFPRPGALDVPMTPRGMAKRLAALGARAGVHCRPHDFRRSYVSTLLDRGVDLATVADLVGHSDPATTRRYDRRGDRAKVAAAAVLTLG